MQRRPGITLIEVLVAIFIMGIGMIALLTLFPLGAINVAQALRHDRASQCATNANANANAWNLRHDANVASAFVTQINAGLSVTGPSSPVYVDPFYQPLAGGTTLSGLSRISPSYVNVASGPQTALWFSLLDDINFDLNGVATGSGSGAAFASPQTVTRTGRYTWAYLLRRPRLQDETTVDMSVVVYADRITQTVDGENAFSATGTLGTTTLTLTFTAGAKPSIRNGSWILDVTQDGKVVRGNFYRVIDAVEVPGSNQFTLELQTPLKSAVASVSTAFTVVVMDRVVEVFDRGTGYTP